MLEGYKKPATHTSISRINLCNPSPESRNSPEPETRTRKLTSFGPLAPSPRTLPETLLRCRRRQPEARRLQPGNPQPSVQTAPFFFFSFSKRYTCKTELAGDRS
ncbi:hypothetical protein Hanom_Chr17g01555361 [Helianthus anomalus]